jgi:hypothetical protein
MNKAFVREPDADGDLYCPRCGSLGEAVTAATLDARVAPAARSRIGASAWYCGYAKCEVAYFNAMESVVCVDELAGPAYPKSPEAPICACFGFSLADVEADAADSEPRRIRALYAQSKTEAARCAELAANGKCCLREVQRLYHRLREQAG